MKNTILITLVAFLVFAGQVFAIEYIQGITTGWVSLNVINPRYPEPGVRVEFSQIDHLGALPEVQSQPVSQEPQGTITGTFIVQPSALWVTGLIVVFAIIINWYLNRNRIPDPYRI